jgi:alpha(1,3/1,4) fucosyltransferase
MKPPIELFRILRRYYNQSQMSLGSQVKLFNYQLHDLKNYSALGNLSVENHWLIQFILSKGYLNNGKSTLSIFGVNGDKLAISINKSDYKIFYTIENVHVKLSPWIKYEDMLLNDNRINLSIGFDYLEHENYLRFPYWVMTMFNPTDDYEIIKAKCNKLNEKKYDADSRNKFCSFICREDYFGDRKYFLELIEQTDNVSCPGNFMHNDDELKAFYNDNKLDYLKQFKFNLCPENSNSSGYVTEKIFDAISAGCIPIYWGSDNKPEPRILNQNAIFFLELNGNNDNVLNEIGRLNKNPKLYAEFINQNKLTQEAPDIIYECFIRLDKMLREMVK